MRIDRGTVPGLALLRVEWLLLQNPRGEFTADRPRLPGQAHPGLGMSQDISALFVLACDRLQLDGLLFVPAHYHTASQGRKSLRFLSPVAEGVPRRARGPPWPPPLGGHPRSPRSGWWTRPRASPSAWRPSPMVMAVTDRLRALIEGEEYERQVAEEAAHHAFRVIGGARLPPLL